MIFARLVTSVHHRKERRRKGRARHLVHFSAMTLSSRYLEEKDKEEKDFLSPREVPEGRRGKERREEGTGLT